MNSEKNNCNLGALFGKGRSGTTWLGSIISSHPDIAYRFEPFHRLQKTNPQVKEILEIIHSDGFSATDLPLVYRMLLPATPDLEKPPFFPKNYRMGLSLGKSFAWPLARQNSLVSHLFHFFYTPIDCPMVIFKEVEMVDILCQLLGKTEIPIVYLVRHPCAVVWSILRGQKASLMPEGRRKFLHNMLVKYNPSLAAEYGEKLEDLTLCEQEALMWRIDVERAVSACQSNYNGLLVVYEELTQNTLEISSKVFHHLGLEIAKESLKFIEESMRASPISRLKRGEVGINPYFTVFRDSQVAQSRWKNDMQKEDITGVMEIVKDSNVFTMIADQGLWN
ncbi:sulfotransferase domain-containing protein [Limnofasciculus baicalensis]|uniref:Sulfotransferase n=1 Tax=Limnofasciculus baicalensis BBK-W-15 TaxID=2699891 RepID=A0AAE3GPF6_9CYAN|nr:sulfotransferase domain-containing protein [Limnofasciculus baicalensis]MCP2727413.1 sulfotransferase [Limnofasciculus baicalensis BBK-W-15]